MPPARWTQELIVGALQRWARDRGRPPLEREWHKAPKPGRWGARRPTVETVRAYLPSFNAALEAAGLPTRSPNNQPRERCPNGHEYSEDNVWRRRDGARLCLACKRVRDREGARRHRARVRQRAELQAAEREAKRKLYAERRAAGLCHCGGERDVPGRLSCSKCLARLRARRRAGCRD
jgi:hypothetical protein